VRRLAIGFGILVLLVVAFRAAMHPVLESEWFRDLVSEAAGRSLGVRIHSAEPLRATHTLIPGVSASAVRIRSLEDAGWWLDAEAEELSLRVALSPLLLGRLEVLMLQADGAKVRFALPETDATEQPSTFDIAGLLDALPLLTHLENSTVFRGRDEEELRLRVDELKLRRCGRSAEFSGRVNDTPLSLQARLECEGPRHLRLDGLKAEVGDTAVQGNLDLAFDAPLRIGGALHTSRFDPATLRGAEDEQAAGSGGLDAWLDRPLPYSWLGRLDLDLTVGAKTLALADLSLREAKVKAKLSKAQLELGATARVDSASIDLDLRADGSDRARLALDAKAKDLPLAQLLGVEGVTGTYALDLKLAGAGRTPREILAGGEGVLHFALGKADFPEPMLGPLGKDVIGILASEFRSAQPTRFECAILHSEFVDGLGSPTALVVDLPDMTLAGGGVIDLRRQHVDLLVRPHPKGTRIIPIKTPLYVSGPFTALKAGVDSAEIVRDAGRLLTDSLLDPRKVASVFVDLGSHGGDACKLDLAREASSRGRPVIDLTTKAARQVGSWVLGIFDDSEQE